MSKFKKFWVVLVITLVLTLLSIITSEKNIDFYFWLFISHLLIVSVLTYYTSNVELRGLKLATAIFFIFFSIGVFNTQIEAIIFNVTKIQNILNYLLISILSGVMLSILLVTLIDSNDSTSEQNKSISIIGWIWRILVADLLYLIMYISAGTLLQIIYPEFMTYYEGKIPSISLIVKTQLFIRGFVFIAIAILINETLHVGRTQRAIFIGTVFAILGAIAPLIVPNELMPLNVRIAHGFETSISNFIYGISIGYLFSK